MVAHIVLFRPRPTLSAADRARLGDVFARAVREIPSIRRARIGQRVTHGRGYELLMRTNFSHAAILEFDDMAALQSYLEHPAHEALGAVFFEAFEEALMYDFELQEGTADLSALVLSSQH